MSSTYLALVNNILTSFNEVNLSSGTFATATGFAADVKRSVTSAVFDIYTHQDTEWPFLWTSFTFNTAEGTQEYSKDSTAAAVDWGSFAIQRTSMTAFTLTQSGGTATFTTSSAHNMETGDSVTITGATPDGYNGTVDVTVTSSTTFTYSVSSSLASSATGTITVKSNTIVSRKLKLIDYDYWENTFLDADENLNSTEYGRPEYIVRKPDNNFLVSTVPDRVYTIKYKGFTLPASMSVHSDTALIPTAFDQVILDKAFHYAYMFRDNIEQAALAEGRYEKNLHAMRRILIPQPEYMKV